MDIWLLVNIFDDFVCALKLMHSNHVMLGDIPAEAIMVTEDAGRIQVMLK